MRYVMTLTAMLAGLSGCGGESHESLLREQLDVMQRMVDAVSEVDDVASAEAAGATLIELIAKREAIQQRMIELGPIEGDSTAAIREEYTDRVAELTAAMATELTRIKEKPQQLEAMRDALKLLRRQWPGLIAPP